MSLTYLHFNYYRGEKCSIQATDGVRSYSIPLNEGNTDYQEYLKWLEEGNDPLPADEPS
jgi:hypothetical protein